VRKDRVGRGGFTLPELATVAAIMGVVASVVVPPLGRTLDRAAVREGVERLAAAHATTRELAISRGVLSRLEIDREAHTVTVSTQRTPTGWDTIATYSLGTAQITCSNPTLVFNPIGLGHGPSNTRVIFTRGAAADTVTTSRTGRLRR
jgi:prepilin-type N-terminal cleavage/methylation domain-containing protein